MASDQSNEMHARHRHMMARVTINKSIDNVLVKLRQSDKTQQEKIDDAVYEWNLGQKKLQAIDF